MQYASTQSLRYTHPPPQAAYVYCMQSSRELYLCVRRFQWQNYRPSAHDTAGFATTAEDKRLQFVLSYYYCISCFQFRGFNVVHMLLEATTIIRFTSFIIAHLYKFIDFHSSFGYGSLLCRRRHRRNLQSPIWASKWYEAPPECASAEPASNQIKRTSHRIEICRRTGFWNRNSRMFFLIIL